MTRREFGTATGTLGAGMLTFSSAAAHSRNRAKSGTAIDQNTIRRRGVGLRALDAARVSVGLTLFTPMMGDGTVYLMDLNGKVVHTWRMPYSP